MKRLLNRTAVLLLMIVMFMTLASASVASTLLRQQAHPLLVNVTEAALERDPVCMQIRSGQQHRVRQRRPSLHR